VEAKSYYYGFLSNPAFLFLLFPFCLSFVGMNLSLFVEFANARLYLDLANAIDISIPVCRNNGPSAYHLPKPSFEPYRAEGFVTSIAEGGKLNCEEIRFYPHGVATHTESLLHASSLGLTMNKVQIPSFQLCALVSVTPVKLDNGDMVVSELPDWIWDMHISAVVIRTLPNLSEKLSLEYSDTNPPYFSVNLMQELANKNILHFVCDLPSVDPEVDGGALLAHKAFFNHRLDACITELAYIPSNVEDGFFVLNLQTPSIETDAVPSRPLLIPFVSE
jgi:arylformamidase